MVGSLEVSLISLGCNNFGTRCDEAESAAVIDAALEQGVTFFDTADIYAMGRSEEYVGRALHRVRDQVAIGSKFGMRLGSDEEKGASRRWTRTAAENSLRRLGTDHIDLYQIHVPDPDTPVRETLEELGRLVDEGKVTEVGCSNFGPAQIDEAVEVAEREGLPRLVSVQAYYNLIHRDPGESVLEASAERGVGFIPFFPLESGLLTGKYRRGEPLPDDSRMGRASPIPQSTVERLLSDDNFDLVEQLEAFAVAEGHSLLELALSFLAGNPAIPTITVGATKGRQLSDNIAATGWELSAEQRARVDAITRVSEHG